MTKRALPVHWTFCSRVFKGDATIFSRTLLGWVLQVSVAEGLRRAVSNPSVIK
jgi:hypothetical protein